VWPHRTLLSFKTQLRPALAHNTLSQLTFDLFAHRPNLTNLSKATFSTTATTATTVSRQKADPRALKTDFSGMSGGTEEKMDGCLQMLPFYLDRSSDEAKGDNRA
jgi:hypothetical protein